MTTVHKLREALEKAQADYLKADIEHPTAVHLAKEALANARFDYWGACADLVTRLPAIIKDQWGRPEITDDLEGIYSEITGAELP